MKIYYVFSLKYWPGNLKFVFFYIMILSLLPGIGFSETPKPIPEGSNSLYFGNIIAGQKFGVRIHDPKFRVQTILKKRGIISDGGVNCDQYLKQVFECNSSKLIDFYIVKKFARHGNLYIEYATNKVDRIVWDFELLPPFDF